MTENARSVRQVHPAQQDSDPPILLCLGRSMIRPHAKEGLTRLDATMRLSECDDHLLRCLIAVDGRPSGGAG